MSSMWRAAIFLPLLLATAPTSSAQYAAPYVASAYAPAPAYSATSVSYAIGDWRRLRQSNGYAFADYARFLITNPGWPAETTLRRWAENAMRPGENSGTVLAFFAKDKPNTGNGWARLSAAYAATGRPADALDAARNAWYEPDLSPTDEQNIWARYGGNFTRIDQDRRVDALLFAKKPQDAQRFIATVSPERQASFAARIAMQSRTQDAEIRYRAVIGAVTTDAGLMMDRARYLRDSGYGDAARQLAARSHNFLYRPADPARFYDMQLLLANEAVGDRQFQTAYNIASQIDDVLPAGASVADQPIGVRDDYTSLAWLGGSVALDRLGQPTNAMAMYDRYARAGRSLQLLTKGSYWAGRAALSSRRFQEANSYFQRAAAYPELFYGQLALERLGRSVTAPPTALPQTVTTAAERAEFANRRLVHTALPQTVTTAAERAEFANRRLVQAVRLMNQWGNGQERSLFVQALAQSLNTDLDRNLAIQFGQQISRNDVPVWVARMARVKGSAFYVRQAYPSLPASVSPGLWSLCHGIARQESSFDQYAMSYAGARGMMQLMRGTAREQADKMGISYDSSRLTNDPNYNVMLGSAYFQRMMNMWNGNVPLAVASYNAGYGNVRKWVNAYGDPRGQVDVLKWIEAIPYTETRAYVQRVIENSVVYDSMRPSSQQQAALHVSRYLGKGVPG